MTTTPNLGMTLVEQSQSQKEVTINEALTTLDAFACVGRTGTAASTNSITFVDVAGMSFDLVAGATYAFRINGTGTATVTAGFRIGSAGTATYTTFRAFGRIDTSGSYAGGFEVTVPGLLLNRTSTAAFRFVVEGVLTVNAAGTFTVQFAQNVANAITSNLTSCWATFQRIA